MAIWLVLGPLLWAAAAFAVPSDRWRPLLIPMGAVTQLALVLMALDQPEVVGWNRWLVLDPLGRYFLLYISVLFLLCASYAPAYLKLRPERPNRVFCAAQLLLLGMMTLITLSHHLGLMWVAIEATTLVTAPSLYFNHNPRSLEATWKYLLICSVGIALALLGSLFLAYAALHAGLESTLLFEDLIAGAPHVSREWMHAAFVLLFVGYGTKMGLAPMHTWKPDAYGEAPGMIGALMAGGATSCAFLAILRIYEIADAAHDVRYLQRIMVFMGLLAMGLAAVSLPRQRDIKRMLAYSSVEHMGMLVFGIGIGGAAVGGSLLHIIHNGFTKGILFLSAANIHRAYGTKFASEVTGVIRQLPFSGWMFLIGFLAITGSPPFSPFVSEFQIVSAAFAQGHPWAGGLFLIMLLFVFWGMGATIVTMCFGPSNSEPKTVYRDSLGTALPVLAFFALSLLLGLYNPPLVSQLLHNATAFLHAR